LTFQPVVSKSEIGFSLVSLNKKSGWGLGFSFGGVGPVLRNGRRLARCLQSLHGCKVSYPPTVPPRKNSSLRPAMGPSVASSLAQPVGESLASRNARGLANTGEEAKRTSGLL
jgi:hypothetical protein